MEVAEEQEIVKVLILHIIISPEGHIQGQIRTTLIIKIVKVHKFRKTRAKQDNR